jgi:hypothetical protein
MSGLSEKYTFFDLHDLSNTTAEKLTYAEHTH